MPSQIVPLSNAPNQSLSVTLSIDSGKLTLQLGVRFSEVADYWILSIADQFGNPLLDSVPMLCGAYPAANLLQQYAYLGIGSCYVINASGVTIKDSPDADSLGNDFVLVWDDTPLV